jgi:hypothetical protein
VFEELIWLVLFQCFNHHERHPSFEMAKVACAADAIAEGILDFSCCSNGQMSPARKRLFEPQQDDATSATPPTTLTLQAFFEALPRPLPEPVDDKTVAEFKVPGSLNRLIQSACGGKFDHKLIWTTVAKLVSMFHFFPPLRPTLSNQPKTHVSLINYSPGLAHGTVL